MSLAIEKMQNVSIWLTQFKIVMIVTGRRFTHRNIVHVECTQCCVLKHKNGEFTKCFFLFILCACVCVSVCVCDNVILYQRDSAVI